MNEQKSVIAPRGIPASGKTTWVQEQIYNAAPGTAARINNDDLAMMLYGVPFGNRSPHTSDMLASMRKQMLTQLLRNPEIQVIFIDNTNLSIKGLKQLEDITHQHNAMFAVNDEFLTVPLQTALDRNAQRANPVPDTVIHDMHKRAVKLRGWNYNRLPKILPYHNDKRLPPTVLVDIDGTLAIKSPERDIYDYTQVHLDTPNLSVSHLITQLVSHGWHITVMSGRSEECREQTQEWLNRNVAHGLPLYMRPAKDHRPDWIVKHELFQQHVANRYHVRFVLDDRDQIITLWRDRIQLPTWQVAHGDF